MCRVKRISFRVRGTTTVTRPCVFVTAKCRVIYLWGKEVEVELGNFFKQNKWYDDNLQNNYSS